MKTASKVTRYIALGLSIAYLAIAALSCLTALGALLIYLIPIIGFVALIYSIIVFPIGLSILFGIACNAYALIAAIQAVMSVAKNKHKISNGVLLAIATVITAPPVSMLAFIGGALIIVSAAFKKNAEKKEAAKAAEEATAEATTEAE